METTPGTPESPTDTSLVGIPVALALFIAAGATAKILPRDTADSLRWLVMSLILLGTVALSATIFSVALRRRSNRFVASAFVASAVIAGAFLPAYLADQDKPVIFSPGLFTAFGTIACAGIAVVLTARLLRALAARALAARAHQRRGEFGGPNPNGSR